MISTKNPTNFSGGSIKKWYEYSDKEKIKEVYSKYTLKDFWSWWSDDEIKFMEIRIRDYALIKQLVNKYKLPYSSSGVYVTNVPQLKTVIAFIRDKATCWFGLNPRKRNYNTRGWRTFSCGQRGGSSDDNVDSISFIFIDIDRVTKIKPAANSELKNCDILAEKIIERMTMQKWSESYIKIASGNGLQLLFKLDFPIKIPNRIFNNEKKHFEFSEEFDKLKKVVKDGIGANLRRFCKRFEDELMVEVDSSGFNMNRVAALPVTKNYKYDGFTWRGIIELKTGTNKGFADYIMSKMNDIKTFKANNVFVKPKKTTGNQLLIKSGKLRDNIMVKFLMENDMKVWYEHLNDIFWFQLKALIRDSKFNLNSEEFREFHRDLERKYNGRFTTNPPADKFDFNVNTVNWFCINNEAEPLYKKEWKQQRNKRLNMKLEDMGWGVQALSSEVLELDSITTIQEDMKFVKDRLTEGDYKNIIVIAKFINGCIKKYGEKKTKFFVENIFDHYLNYS